MKTPLAKMVERTVTAIRRSKPDGHSDSPIRLQRLSDYFKIK